MKSMKQSKSCPMALEIATGASAWKKLQRFLKPHCKVTGDFFPLREILRPYGLDLMTDTDKRLRDIVKAGMERKAPRRRKCNLEESL